MGLFSSLLGPVESIFKGLEKVPGSPEALLGALYGGVTNKLSWNPYSSRNSVWDFLAGGSQLSQSGNNRKIGRTIGTLLAAYYGGGALASNGSGGADAATTTGGTGGLDASSAGWGAGLSGDATGFGLGGTADMGAGLGGMDAAAPAVADASSTAASSSYYDNLMRILKGTSGKSWMRGAAGLYGLYNAQQVKNAYKMPPASAMPNMPGYQAGLQAVQAAQAAQGYTGSSNAQAAIAKYGADFYNQYINQQMGMAAGQSGANVSAIGSLGLLASAFGG